VDGSNEKGLSLHDEIKLKAELALKEAMERSHSEAMMNRPIRAAMETTSMLRDLSKATSSQDRFIPSLTFAGAREGYVFKMGDEGLGYYLDTRQLIGSGGAAEGIPNAALREDSAIHIDWPTPLDDDTTGRISPNSSFLRFDFDCRQTKQTIAVLVQVPSIDAASVHIEFATHQLRVSFRAVGHDGLLPGSQYGMILAISPLSTCAVGFDPEQCKYDVACQNMAIVLVKSIPAYWSVKSDCKEASPDAAMESKSSVDSELQSTKELLRVLPYESKYAVESMSKYTAAGSSPAEVPERSKSLPKSLENMITNMQFSSSAVLFDLD